MPAYMVLDYDADDPEALAAYREAATPMLLGPGLAEVVAVRDATVALPEGVAIGTHAVSLRLEDVRQARAVYDTQDHQSVPGDRLAATRPSAALIAPGV
jgi:uncharacterized protein (DUF1330 family)